MGSVWIHFKKTLKHVHQLSDFCRYMHCKRIISQLLMSTLKPGSPEILRLECPLAVEGD